MVEVISRKNCQPCRLTKKWLEDRGISYGESFVEDEATLERAKNLGHLAAPVVIVGENHWSGFRPDLLELHASSVLV